jgi:hypothetical protein
VKKFVGDAVVAEVKSPTLAKNTLVTDICNIAIDYQSGTIGHLFGDLYTMGGHLAAEANVVSAYHLPSSWCLMGNTTVYNDLHHIAYDANSLIAINNVILTFASWTPTSGQTSSGGSAGLNYAYASMNQMTSTMSMPYDSNPTSLGGYPSASGMGITMTAGSGGEIFNQQFNSIWGASANTMAAMLADTGNLTGNQLNVALGSYLPSNFTSNFMQQNSGIAALIGVGTKS